MKKAMLNITMFVVIIYLAAVPMALSGITILSDIGQPLATFLYYPFKQREIDAGWLPRPYFDMWCNILPRCEYLHSSNEYNISR